VSRGSALDVRELLRLLAEQQASLGKLQQLVVEHVLSESEPGPSTVNTSSAPASDLVTAIDASNVVSSAQEKPSDAEVVRSTEPEPIVAAGAPTPAASGPALPDSAEATPPPPAELPSSSSSSPAPTVSVDSPFGSTPIEDAVAIRHDAPVASVRSAANSRAGRYLGRPATTPAKQVTNQELYRLSRLRDVGDVAQLVLQFGEYRGATLFQVAQSDPDYLRSLALTAQRPQVRAAAMQLVRALEASQQSASQQRTPKTSSRRHDG
jgi:hypothetical protein